MSRLAKTLDDENRFFSLLGRACDDEDDFQRAVEDTRSARAAARIVRGASALRGARGLSAAIGSKNRPSSRQEPARV